MLRRLMCVCLLCALGSASTGCATSSRVKQGALYGGLAGAAVGAGGGWALSDPNLRGTEAGPRHGDTQLSVGTSVAAGAAVGLVVGAIVGAMVGHQRDDRIEPKPRGGDAAQPAPTPSGDASSASLAPQPRL
jgi:hypothetical protein